MNKLRVLLLPLLACCACVDLPAGTAPAAAPQPVQARVQPLDPGAKTVESAHFAVQAYGSEAAGRHSAALENNYTRIMQDLGLYSFVPARPYNVTVYRDAAEFHAKTGMPEWSGGAAYGNALLLCEGGELEATMAHEMTHLVFHEFMGLSQDPSLRWLDEGVAVYEETRSNQASAAYYDKEVKALVASNPIPFSQMVNLAPLNESRTGVERWYAQVGSVAAFLVKKGGSFNFSLLLGRLKGGAGMDRAIADTYPGVWRGLSDVEKAWQLELAR
jgi:hypothetical protein